MVVFPNTCRIFFRTVPKVFMNPEPGPEIEGYQGEDFIREVQENPEDLVEVDIEGNIEE